MGRDDPNACQTCNKYNVRRCCLASGCRYSPQCGYPCYCSRGKDTCLLTDETRKKKIARLQEAEGFVDPT